MEPNVRGLKNTIRVVAYLNLAYFFVEFAVAQAIGSVSLFADSVDFLEDAFVNFLILFALGWSLRRRARVGTVLAGTLLVPGLFTLWTAWHKFQTNVPPEPLSLTAVGAGAFIVNFVCAYRLTRYRKHAGSMARAAFLSARNDVFANVAIVTAGFVTAFTHSIWPDLAVGIGIALINIGAAKEVYEAAREEHRSATLDAANEGTS